MIILLHATKEVKTLVNNSRADYFKERRENFKAFHVEVERKKMEQFEKKLATRNKSKKKWLDEKIDEELEK